MPDRVEDAGDVIRSKKGRSDDGLIRAAAAGVVRLREDS